jgi:sialic acid synthase SpsE
MITTANVRSVRPGFGLAPKHLQNILGKRFVKDAVKGTPMAWELVE